MTTLMAFATEEERKEAINLACAQVSSAQYDNVHSDVRLPGGERILFRVTPDLESAYRLAALFFRSVEVAETVPADVREYLMALIRWVPEEDENG